MIDLASTTHDDVLRRLLQGTPLDELLTASSAPNLHDVVSDRVATTEPEATPAEAADLTARLHEAIVAVAEAEIAAGCRAAFCLDARVLAAVSSGHQLVAWRTIRDAWLATHNASLDGMYVRQRLANELPDYELCNGAFCQSTTREAPSELAAEAARVGGEVRWYLPERRLVAAVKFPLEFKGTEHARWCIRRKRSRFVSSHTLHGGDLDDERWQGFVEGFVRSLAETLQADAGNVRRHGATFELTIDVRGDDTDA